MQKKPSLLKRSIVAFGIFASVSAPATADVGSPGLNGNGKPPRTARDILNKTANAFNDIAQKAVPAVVSVSVVKSIDHSEAAMFPFGGVPMPGPEEMDPQRSIGLGSGVLIRADGMILTNNHVVEDAEKITVTFDEKHKLPAKVIGTDPKTDLAVIKIDGKKADYPVLKFSGNDEIKVGDWAIAIGSPFGLNRSVSSGIISAKGRAQMGILDIEDFIQTDAAINPGSSGGPLLNISGEMIGINTAIFSQGSGFVGIGFAIPASIAREVSQQLIKDGHVKRGWIGIAAQDLDDELAKYFKAPNQQGALISDVAPNGPANQAAIQPGDVVVKYDQKPVENASELRSLVGKTPAGSQVEIELSHSGKVKKTPVVIREQPREPKPQVVQQAGRVGKKGEAEHPNFGLVLEDVPAELAGFLHVQPRQGALVVGVEPGSPAFEAGLSPGDVILKADRKSVSSAKDVMRITSQTKEDIAVLYVQRGPEERVFVPVKRES